MSRINRYRYSINPGTSQCYQEPSVSCLMSMESMVPMIPNCRCLLRERAAANLQLAKLGVHFQNP